MQFPNRKLLNKYISKILHDSSQRMLDNLEKLTKFMWDSNLFFEMGPESNPRMELWPAYIVIDNMGIEQETRDKQFYEYWKTLKSLVQDARSAYTVYRSNIREILFL